MTAGTGTAVSARARWIRTSRFMSCAVGRILPLGGRRRISSPGRAKQAIGQIRFPACDELGSDVSPPVVICDPAKQRTQYIRSDQGAYVPRRGAHGCSPTGRRVMTVTAFMLSLSCPSTWRTRLTISSHCAMTLGSATCWCQVPGHLTSAKRRPSARPCWRTRNRACPRRAPLRRGTRPSGQFPYQGSRTRPAEDALSRKRPPHSLYR